MKIEDLLLSDEKAAKTIQLHFCFVPWESELANTKKRCLNIAQRIRKAQIGHILTLFPALKTAIETGAELAVLDKEG